MPSLKAGVSNSFPLGVREGTLQYSSPGKASCKRKTVLLHNTFINISAIDHYLVKLHIFYIAPCNNKKVNVKLLISF